MLSLRRRRANRGPGRKERLHGQGFSRGRNKVSSAFFSVLTPDCYLTYGNAAELI